VKGIVPQAREKFVYKLYLSEMEKTAKRYEQWIGTKSPGHVEAMREFMKQMLAQQSKAA